MLLNGWFIHTCSRKRRTGVDSNGLPSYGAIETFRARVEKVYAFVRGPDEKEVLVQNKLVTTESIVFTDMIWLPSVNGEPADDTSTNDASRYPQTIAMASNKMGTQKLTEVTFR